MATSPPLRRDPRQNGPPLVADFGISRSPTSPPSKPSNTSALGERPTWDSFPLSPLSWLELGGVGECVGTGVGRKALRW